MTDDTAHHLLIQRRRLLEAVVDAMRADPEWEGHVVCGFALVVELAGADGQRGIATRSSDATGDTDLTPWSANGLVNYALSDGMFDAIDLDYEEDEEDDGDDD